MAGLLSLATPGLNALTTHSLSGSWVKGSGKPARCDICCVPSPEGLGLAPAGKGMENYVLICFPPHRSRAAPT